MMQLTHLAARLVHLAYWYCVDFMVNLANLTHTSYPEANTWVLLLLLPGLLLGLVGVRVGQWLVLRHWRRAAARRRQARATAILVVKFFAAT